MILDSIWGYLSNFDLGTECYKMDPDFDTALLALESIDLRCYTSLLVLLNN